MNPEHEVPSRYKPGTGMLLRKESHTLRGMFVSMWRIFTNLMVQRVREVHKGSSVGLLGLSAHSRLQDFFAGILPRTWPGLMSASVAEEIFREEGRELNLNMPMIA